MWNQELSMMWEISNLIRITNFLLERSQAKNPNHVKAPKLKLYPWSPDQDIKHYGKVDEEDQVDAVNFLLGLSPPPQ
ncbi:hypothetical protein [Corynebacterium diphtheriae]|nr:hypothetical protein [Corynebacterium diphtheriae]